MAEASITGPTSPYIQHGSDSGRFRRSRRTAAGGSPGPLVPRTGSESQAMTTLETSTTTPAAATAAPGLDAEAVCAGRATCTT